MDPSATERLLPKPAADDVENGSANDLDDDIQEFQDYITKGLNNTLQGSANLSNMLPTGSVLFFQIMDPILFRAGTCEDKNLSAAFLIICALICFILSFTDSFHASNGKVYYGLATFKGLWTPQLESKSKLDLSSYRIRKGDFAHAFLAVLTFFTTTSFSTDVISCFVDIPERLVRAGPALSGFLVSAIFLIFPTTRHGVGFPVTPPTSTATGSTSAAGTANGSTSAATGSTSAAGTATGSDSAAGTGTGAAGSATGTTSTAANSTPSPTPLLAASRKP